MTPASEHIERAALEDLHAAIPAPLAQALGVRSLRIGSAFVSLASALPPSAIVINRAIGLGLAEPAGAAAVRELVAAYADAQVAEYFIHVHPDAAPSDLRAMLQAAGLVKTRGWQKFERGPQPVRPATTDLRIVPVGREHGEAFARIVCDAFDLGAVAEPWLAEIPGRPDWHAFMSFEGDTPAGTGAVFVRDDLAWLDFGATAPQFRRRGSQAALMTRRLQHALELGCRAIFTCTGEDVPGDPQHSYRNMLKAGFHETYLRENYTPRRD